MEKNISYKIDEELNVQFASNESKRKGYLESLMMQFMLATGRKSIDISLDLFSKEFKEWIKRRQLDGKKYVALLECLGIEYMSLHTAEIGKGQYDSIVYKNGKTTIITPFSDEFKEMGSNLIIHDSKVYDKFNIMACCKNNSKILFPNITNIMTQNPYEISQIYKWAQIHNNGYSNITVGMYGDVQDEDRNEKIDALKILKEKLSNENYIERFATVADSYMYVLSTFNIEEEKIKVLI